MDLPNPTDQQSKWIWYGITALAISILISFALTLIFGFALLFNKLSAILIPLAIAGIGACLLDPLVVFLGEYKIKRHYAVILVFAVIGIIITLFLSWVIPMLVFQITDFIHNFPALFEKLRANISNQILYFHEHYVTQFAWGVALQDAWNNNQIGTTLQDWLSSILPGIGSWVMGRISQVLSLGSLLIGIILIPIYIYFFLIEKEPIVMRWRNYIPLWESRAKEETIWFLNTVSESMVVFFRGQIIVAICEGLLLTMGFFLIGMKYALLIGAVAGVFSIIPYLGMALSIVPAVLLAVAQFGDLTHPLFVVCVYIAVHLFDGYIVFPRIIGDRVGMHPLIIIVAVLIGTTLMGGVIGAILAIPVTAVLRALLHRYIWGPPQTLPAPQIDNPDEKKK